VSPPGTWPAGGHPADALSGLIDDELPAGERDVVAAHVQRCPECAEELRGLRAVRAAVRALPPVEPPPGLLDRLVADPAWAARPRRRPPRRATATATVTAVAMAVALVLLVPALSGSGPYRPEVERAVVRHVASVSALSAVGATTADGGPRPLAAPAPVTPSTAPPHELDDLPAPYQAPAELAGGYRLVDAFSHPEGIQLVYERGRYGLSVFETPGELDRAGLAPRARVVEGPAPAWRLDADGMDGRLVVLEREGMVVTAVGDEPGDAVLAAASSLPEPRPLSVGQRLRRTATQVLRALSPS
jgi:anti-sigma factor RsiW